MARGKKTGGRDFKPGESGNPKGSPGLPHELKEARTLNAAEATRILNRFVHMTQAELTAVQEDPAATALERIILAVVMRGIIQGDERALGFLLDRLIGKVKEPTLDFNFNFNMLPRSQVIELGKEAVRFLEARERKGDK